MAITPGVLGDWLVDVAPYVPDTTPGTGDWVRLHGITELTPPKIEKNMEDDGEYDGTYWGSQVATGISWTSEATVKTPRATLAPDPAQVILKEAGLGVAEEGLANVRFTKRGSTEAQVGVADVQWAENGGPKTDITTAGVTLTGRGALVDVPVDPDAEPTLP